jgi:quinol---cytochrome-c reductase cytochrome b subunit
VITKRLARWFDDRLAASSFARSALNKVFPDHWSFMLGEVALYCLVVLILTGTYLTFFFSTGTHEVVYHGSYAPLNGAHVSEAYASVLRISFDVRAGMVMRQTHHWAANVFIAAIVVHLLRIFFTGAYRRPREINWIVGISMLLLGIFNGFSGYSMPDDLLSGTGLRIAYSIAQSVPFVGTWLAFLVFGGEFPSDQIIHRLFIVHVMIVPGLLVALVTVHLVLIWHQKHTQFPGKGRTESNVVGSTLWPTYAAKSIGLFFAISAVLAALGGLAQVNPIWLYGPYDPSSVSSPAQPDWYLGWIEGALRIFPRWEIRAFGHSIPNVFFPAVVLPGLTFTVLYMWPFLEQRFTGDRLPHNLLDHPHDRPGRTAIGCAAFSFYALLFFAASNDVIAKVFNVSVSGVTWVFRILVVTVPPMLFLMVFRAMDAMKRSGAHSFLEVPLSALVRRDGGSPPPRTDGEPAPVTQELEPAAGTEPPS